MSILLSSTAFFTAAVLALRRTVLLYRITASTGLNTVRFALFSSYTSPLWRFQGSYGVRVQTVIHLIRRTIREALQEIIGDYNDVHKTDYQYRRSLRTLAFLTRKRQASVRILGNSIHGRDQCPAGTDRH